MSAPVVSIVIPCFNAERTIADAIQSALCQTYPRTEVIVVDDGSTDGSLEIIRSFGNVVRWLSGPNRGACAARNRGIAASRGAMIQFLDADDILLSEKIQRQVDAALVGQQQICYCDGEVLGDCAGAPYQSFRAECSGIDPVVFVLRNQLPTPAPLHLRTMLERVRGFNEQLPCSQERDLHLRLAAHGATFLHVPETLYLVRRMPNGISSDPLRVLDQHKYVFGSVYDYLKETDSLTDEHAEAFAGARLIDGVQYLRLGRRDKAQACFRDAYLMHHTGGRNVLFRTRLGRAVHKVCGPMNAYRVAQARKWTKEQVMRLRQWPHISSSPGGGAELEGATAGGDR